MKNKFDKKSLGWLLCGLLAIIVFVADHIYFASGMAMSIAALPIAGRFINRNSGANDGGGDAAKEKQEAAEKKVQELAKAEAEKYFEGKKDDFLKEAMKGEDNAQLIKDAAKEALEGLDISKVEIEDNLGRKHSLNTILDTLQEKVNKMQISLKASKGALDAQVNTVMGQLKAQFEANSSQLAEIHKTSKGLVSFEIKAVSPITTASFGDRVIIGLREPGVDYPVLPQRFIFDIISTMTGGPGSNPLSWVELVNGSGAPAWQTSEGADKSGMNWTYVEGKVTAEMIAVYTPVSRQALLNWPMLEQEIRFELVRRLFNKLDQAVIAGTGTGEPFGILYYADSFDAGALAHTVPYANRGDVLRAAIGQVYKGAADASPEIGGFNPTFILVSQDTYTSMDLEKSVLNGQYLYPRFMDDSSTRIKGIPIIASNFIADNDFIVGDFTRYLFNFVENIRIDVGYINAQFIQNLVTVRAELYGMGRVKAHEQAAFVKGDFPTAISQLSMAT